IRDRNVTGVQTCALPIYEYKEIWESSEKEKVSAEVLFDVEKDWRQLRSKIDQDHRELNTSFPSGQHQNRARSINLRRRFVPFLRVAAIILVTSLASVLADQNLYHQPEAVTPALREISMEKGQRGNITLSDGAKVIHNDDSKIIVAEVFQSDKRGVTLSGVAFFEVTHTPDRPFIINTGQAVVEVLGTSLDVRSYPDDESVQVVVSDGRVSLSAKRECADKNAILTTGDMGKFWVKENRITSKRVDDLELYLGWKNGLLKFREAPMAEVATELERRYDIEVYFADPELKDLRLTAELKSRTIRSNMEVIATSLGLEFKMDQQEHEITFYYNNKD